MVLFCQVIDGGSGVAHRQHHQRGNGEHPFIPSSPSSGSRLSAESTTFIPINMMTPINNKYKSPTSTHSHLASPTSALDVPTCVPANNNFQSKVKGRRIQPRPHSDSPVNTPRRGYRGGVSTNNSSNYGGSAFVPPLPTKKYKTELCKNFNKPGGCKFANGCHYIHSEMERRSTDIMPKWPCSILTSTGHCPYENRCPYLHDPLVMRGNGDDCEGIIVPGHCTRATKDGSPVDCQYHHNINSITQVNSIIAPDVWSNCSPTISKASAFERTYSMVCNATGILPLPGDHSTCTKSNTPNMSYSDSVKLNSPAKTVFDELQKLCIVLRLLDMDDDVRESFIYRPDHFMSGQLCKVLQTRYFRLLPVDGQPFISMSDIVVEVSNVEYHAGKMGISPETFVSVHEVVFDASGRRQCNHSFFFDTLITPCTDSQAKKMSKKGQNDADAWHLDGKSLFVMPKNDEFKKSFLANNVHVLMRPIADLEAAPKLMKDILKHRISDLLLTLRRCGLNEPTKTLDQLEETFNLQSAELERWAWPETSNKDNFSKGDDKNRASYTPSITKGNNKENNVVDVIWNSFLTNLGSPDTSTSTNFNTKRRLEVFHFEKTKSSSLTPHFKPIDTTKGGLFRATWRNILLGEESSMIDWKNVIENERAKKNAKK